MTMVYRSHAQRLSITAIVLSYDESVHIERCLRNVLQIAERVIVVDSYSKDATCDIARHCGAEVVQRVFKHQADQFQWALDTLEISSDWVLRLDADEYLESALISEIQDRLPKLPASVAGVRLKRKLIFRDRWIKYGGYYPTVLLRLWRPGSAEVQQLQMDEHIVLRDAGSEIIFNGDFCDHNLRDITWWTDKHNRYATRKMADFIAMEYRMRVDSERQVAHDKARAIRRFLQYTVFRRTPLYVRAVLLFVYRYFLRLGFLDGKPGFIWNAFQGFWYAMLIDAKVDEARNYIAAHGLEAFQRHLVERHGIAI